jgi:hypothetical protein
MMIGYRLAGICSTRMYRMIPEQRISIPAIGRLAATLRHRASRPNMVAAASMALLFALNAYIARPLFWVDFTSQMESIEGSYMSISRWAMQHWHDRAWFPLWFTGSPFDRVYQPGLHLSVAELARTLAWTPEHAYHFLTGLAYCAGPVALYWLCYRMTGRKGYALVAGLTYSLCSTTTILLPVVMRDTGGPLLARNYQVLVHYGEGPHMTALALLPIVVWILDRACSTRGWFFVLISPLALAAVALTNWPGAMGLTMALIAYVLAMSGPNWTRRLLTLAGIGATAYLIAIPWVSPSIVHLVLSNAQQSDATPVNDRRLLRLCLLGVGLIAVHFALRRTSSRGFRFFLYFTAIAGAVSITPAWFHQRLIPQPNRFQVEFDMAAAGLIAFAAAAIFGRLPRAWKAVVLATAVAGCCFQVRRFGAYASRITAPLDITSTIEYRMAKWFDAHMDGRRVFAPGNVSLWMNMFTNVPQVAGCCDQGIPNVEYRIAEYVIYTGQNAGSRDVEISLIWLKAYGAAAIGVTGPRSTEYIKPYSNPRKFDGLLPELWRDGDNVIYGIPRPSYALAHVIDKSAVVLRAPENGLVVEPLQPLVAALDHAKPPFATFRWLNQHEANIVATVARDDLVFVQETYAAGWRATEQGVPLTITPDALGMMEIRPTHAGLNTIRLVYDGSAEAVWTRWAQLAGLMFAGLWSAASWRRARIRRHSES